MLSFLTGISSSDTVGANIRGEAKQLVNKMRLHQPAPAGAEVPAEVAKEEKRKRDKRLAKKNGQPLGAPASDPPTETTTEHVQRSAPVAEERKSTPSEKTSAEYRLRKAKAQKDYYQRKKEAQLAVQAAKPAAPQEAGPRGMASQDAPQAAASPALRRERRESPQANTVGAKVTVCPPALSPEEEERKHGTLDAASGHTVSRQGDLVRSEEGKWEYDPEERRMGEAEEIRNAQPRPVATKNPMATAAKPCHVKKRVKGDIVHFLVIRDGDGLPEEVFDTESEVKAFCRG